MVVSNRKAVVSLGLKCQAAQQNHTTRRWRRTPSPGLTFHRACPLRLRLPRSSSHRPLPPLRPPCSSMAQLPPGSTSLPPQRQDVYIAVQQALAAQLRDFSHILLASKRAGCSMLEAAASLGWLELLAQFLHTFHTNDPQPPDIRSDVCAAALAAVAKRQPVCLQMLLHFATISTSPFVTDLLDARATFGRTLLHLAADTGDVDCMQLLLQHSPLTQVAATDSKGHIPLMYAASSGHASCLPLLLAHSPHTQVAAVGSHEWNALMSAAMSGHTSCMQLLLTHSPEVQVAETAYDGRSALSIAAGYANVDSLQLLLAHSPTQQQLDRALLEAGEALSVHQNREEDSPDDEEPELDNTQAYEEYEQGLKKCIERLLANGAMLTSPPDEGVTAVVRCINKELAARALVPEMANEAVVGLASAVAERKRQARGGDAAGPRKHARPSP